MQYNSLHFHRNETFKLRLIQCRWQYCLDQNFGELQSCLDQKAFDETCLSRQRNIFRSVLNLDDPNNLCRQGNCLPTE